MGVSGGDPTVLDAAAGDLDTTSGDLAEDATTVAGLGKTAGGAAPGEVGQLAETVLAAIGGAVTASSTLVAGLSKAATLSGDQLVKATGGGR